jgi:hypothetical protein
MRTENRHTSSISIFAVTTLNIHTRFRPFSTRGTSSAIESTGLAVIRFQPCAMESRGLEVSMGTGSREREREDGE